MITVDEVQLTEDDKRAVVEALRKSRAFMSLMKKRNIPVARLMWAHSSEFDECSSPVRKLQSGRLINTMEVLLWTCK